MTRVTYPEMIAVPAPPLATASLRTLCSGCYNVGSGFMLWGQCNHISGMISRIVAASTMECALIKKVHGIVKYYQCSCTSKVKQIFLVQTTKNSEHDTLPLFSHRARNTSTRTKWDWAHDNRYKSSRIYELEPAKAEKSNHRKGENKSHSPNLPSVSHPHNTTRIVSHCFRLEGPNCSFDPAPVNACCNLSSAAHISAPSLPELQWRTMTI